jgi:hypothetical protein
MKTERYKAGRTRPPELGPKKACYDLAHHSEKTNNTQSGARKQFFIKIQIRFTRNTEVTVLPLSFNY